MKLDLHRRSVQWTAALACSAATTIVYAQTLPVPLVQTGLNWTTIVVAALVALPPTLVGIASLRAHKRTKHELNSRPTELVDEVRKRARLEGQLEGKAQEKAEEAGRRGGAGGGTLPH